MKGKQEVDLLTDPENEHAADSEHGPRGQLPEFYEPEPFIVPEISGRHSMNSQSRGTDVGNAAGGIQLSRPASRASDVTSSNPSGGPPGAPGSSSRKGGMPSSFRPVNFIVHDDGGEAPSPTRDSDEPETVELPPAYQDVRSRGGASASTSGLEPPPATTS